MPREVVWLPDAERELLELPHWRDAEAVATAVQGFAERAIGFVRRVPRDDRSDDLRLYAGKHYVQIRMSPAAVHVVRVVRWRE